MFSRLFCINGKSASCVIFKAEIREVFSVRCGQVPAADPIIIILYDFHRHCNESGITGLN